MSSDLEQILNRQDGLIARTQALAAGVTPSALRHALRPSGRWQRVLPGIYATSTGTLRLEQRLVAATLYGGPTAMITGAAACRVFGLRYVPDDGAVVRIIVDARTPRADVEFVRVVASHRMPRPMRRHLSVAAQSWPRPSVVLAPPHRAVMDEARRVGSMTSLMIPRTNAGRPVLTVPGVAGVYGHALRDVRALISESVQRGVAHLEDLLNELEDGPRRGSGLARRALADVAAGCRSAPECEFRDLVLSSDILPVPLFNQPLPNRTRIVPDACWPEARLIVEIDSAEWHRFGEAPERTERRRAMLAAMGWRVIPVSPRRLRAEPAVVLAEIEQAYSVVRAA